MVMFKAKFKPASDKPQAAAESRSSGKPQSSDAQSRDRSLATAQAQQQQQPQSPPPKVPPIEEERGPQNPVKLPGQPGAPERVRDTQPTA